MDKAIADVRNYIIAKKGFEKSEHNKSLNKNFWRLKSHFGNSLKLRYVNK